MNFHLEPHPSLIGKVVIIRFHEHNEDGEVIATPASTTVGKVLSYSTVEGYHYVVIEGAKAPLSYGVDEVYAEYTEYEGNND